MAVLTINPDLVALADMPVEVHTGYAAEAIARGQLVRFAPATGRVELANSAAAGNLGQRNFIAIGEANAAGIEISIAGPGNLVDLGEALAALNLDAAVYANDADGSLGDAAGTSSRVVGRVEPVYGVGDGTNVHKALRIV